MGFSARSMWKNRFNSWVYGPRLRLEYALQYLRRTHHVVGKGGRMADGMYVAMSAATARARQLDAVADSLANAQTPGFKGEVAAFHTFMPGGEGSEMAQVAAVKTAVDARSGETITTGRPLDVLPEEGTYLGVRLPSGDTAYTRSGRMTMDENGQLKVGRFAVLGQDGQPITIPFGATPRVDDRGLIWTGDVPLAQLSLSRIDGPMERVTPNVFRPQHSQDASMVQGRVSVGAIEGSNVDAMRATVEMVNVQRSFENAMQAIETYKRLDARAVEIARTR